MPAIVEIELRDRGDTRRIVFTGDLGRRGLPLLRDPKLVPGCDILITESTCGDRSHPTEDDLKKQLLQTICEAAAVDGKVTILAFSLGRTQQVVYFLNTLANDGQLPQMPIFVDSPLSRRITSVYRHHRHVLDAEVPPLLVDDSDPFGFRGLTYITSRQESIALNHRTGPFVVISANSMCESGRVLHHLRHLVTNPKTRLSS